MKKASKLKLFTFASVMAMSFIANALCTVTKSYTNTDSWGDTYTTTMQSTNSTCSQAESNCDKMNKEYVANHQL